LSAIITFDDSLWPLVILRAQGVPTDQEMKEYHARSLSYLERGEKYVTIADLGQLGMLSPSQRRMQAEYLQENAAALHERLLGSATIVDSTPLRLALYAILPFKRMPMPFVVVADMDSAVRYALRRLEESGLGEAAARIRHQLEQRPPLLG
jgi:hypothetical protein